MDDTLVIHCQPLKIEGSSSNLREQFTQLPEPFHVAIQGGLTGPKFIDFKDWREDNDITIPYEPIALHRCSH